MRILDRGLCRSLNCLMETIDGKGRAKSFWVCGINLPLDELGIQYNTVKLEVFFDFAA